MSFLKSSKCILHKLHIDGHKLGNKGLHVVDGLVPLLQPVLIEGSNLAQLCLQLPITVLHQLLLQPNKDDLECQGMQYGLLFVIIVLLPLEECSE